MGVETCDRRAPPIIADPFCSSSGPRRPLISDSGSKAQDKGDTRDHMLKDPFIYVVFPGPIAPERNPRNEDQIARHEA